MNGKEGQEEEGDDGGEGDDHGIKRKREDEETLEEQDNLEVERASPSGQPSASAASPSAVQVDAYGGGEDADAEDGVVLSQADAVTAAALASAAAEASSRVGGRSVRQRTGRMSLQRRLVDVLRGDVELQVEVDDGSSSDDDDEEGNGEEPDIGEGEAGEEDEQEEDAAENVVVLGRDDNESRSGSESHSDLDIPSFREQLTPFNQVALTLWRSSIFRGPAELTGECALAVSRWVEKEQIRPADLEDEMLLCILRCLERGHAMFEEEEDLVRVFTTAVALTETKECVRRLLERGALRAMIRGLQSSAHLLLDEDTDWVETEQLVRIYKAFKTLWQACCDRPANDPQRKSITELVFTALGKWLRSVPLQDVWIGEDDILVFWVLIPLWPNYLDHLEASASEKATEEKGRFKEICNWVLWPNDPVVETGYRLIGHLDFKEGADFSLRFLLSEDRFRWIVTPATKQRYLQHRVSKVALAQAGGEDAETPSRGLVLVVNRETPLQDLCKQLGVTGYTPEPISLLGGITVHFRGGDGEAEDGIDEGGPWREAIPLMFSELLSPNHGLFELLEDGEVLPRWCAADLVPDYQAQFELCGMLIGMALVYQAYAPAHFSRCFLKHLIGLARNAEDVPALAEQIRHIQAAGAGLEDLCLTFSVDDAQSGQTAELLPDGARIGVTSDNAEEYIRLRKEWELEGRFSPLMPYILKGLHCIVPPDVLEAFSQMVTAEELDVMLAGHGINIQDWREHTEYDGYAENSNIITWFWEAVEGFTAQEREDLWTFISGSKGVPPGGFGNLTNAAGESIRFTIAKVTASPDHLPVAHTCGYQLDLAEYETSEDLAKKLRQAMSHRQGFGLA
eukprot:TRINITY_DN96718_c0_g1_i1.p1 TRINITY_DN96718_c0_g1~~TRINITY_DN96718_c0_g1_i1.p1  ORF type:complete len:852 (+),score=188.60 TRINITY_DN96718_c0_g1_i1:33-2588(+)